MKSVLASALFASVALTAAPAIGIVTATGHFTVGNSDVWGNATLFDGTAIQTSGNSSELALRGGVKVQLGAGSAARVFTDHVRLDSGVGQIAPAAPFEVDASGFKIRGAGVRVGLGKTLEVAALSGVAKIYGNGDVLLAAVPAGHQMNFAFQAAQSGQLTRSGCMVYKESRFIVQDDNTQEVVELSGNQQDLARNLGNRVEVKGTASTARPAVSIATSVLAVATVSPVSQGGCLVVAQNLNAQTSMPQAGAPTSAQTPAAPTPVPAATHTGLSTGVKTAIIVGVVGGGGAAAALALTSNKKSTSP